MIVSDVAKHLGEIILREIEPFENYCASNALELYSDDIYLGKVKGVDIHVTLRWDHVKEKRRPKTTGE